MKLAMKTAFVDVLRGGFPGTMIVHYVNPHDHVRTLCGLWEDGRVANFGTELDVDCITCLIRASRRRPGEEH